MREARSALGGSSLTGEADSGHLPEASPKRKPVPTRVEPRLFRVRLTRVSVRVLTFVLVASLLALALAPTKLWELSASGLVVSLVALFVLSYLDPGDGQADR
jgi:hypothetical protein